MDIGKFITNWSPTVVTILIVIAIYYSVRFVLDRQSKNSIEDKSLLRTIVLFMIVLVGAIIIILAIPMPESLKGQVTSLIGIVISAVLALSSATFIGNGLAGIMLRAVNNFRTGDFIHVNDHFGRVSERGLFHTEIQTENRDLITLPNLLLATNPVRVVRASGTFISGVVSLGYDVNHNKIKEVLLEAAKKAELSDPFVRVTELGDFSVVYKVFGLLKDAKTVITAESRLNSQILDALHNANIEIVSPSFMNQRQVGETIFIPKKVRANKEVADAEKVEEKIFDKAEKAESIDKRKDTVASVEENIKNLDQQIKNATDEDKPALVEKRERLLNIKTKMMERLDSKIEEMSSE